ncbi:MULTISPECIES: allantoate amidohydrolase [unclassified Janthinobacterium]|uniref:allantoate amidohydrolase n=1 Tax=unclassified Janthinobacterium TaxID=2610881 RepID=UPI00161D7DDA|nr:MULTISPECIES: allantoate amidohydrolase [unclassified Janthinobacterium]MBB5370999.1 N-carbamoyl-L-amino-acid hydrolase [Janthinobacterium sp. K2C7]MBB5383805.1 N-carbamoyl-L-amino-acid hydrolase [Janthinobacterium sp. K2Li3]MBB5388310.1 N-carbamoyl-L-amino-acid hydrolase [Janthinobacterium sp. K2E3]
MTTLSDLNSSSDIGFVDLLHGIYEHSPWIAQRAAAARPFGSITALKRALQNVLAQASPAEQLGLIRAHPELAGKAAIAGQLTAESTREQARSGLNLCSPEEFSTLQRLNSDYNAKFGFPFILAVKGPTGAGLTRQEIITTFARRLKNRRADELAESLRQIKRIAELRLNDLLDVRLVFGPAIMQHAETLASWSDSAYNLTCAYMTPAHRQTADQLAEWMREAGMQVHIDAVGNVVGRYLSDEPGAKSLMTGSHYDTVRNGGKYDGRLGILLPIAVARHLHQRGEKLPFHFEVVAFAEEEGVRFKSTFLGSTAVTGKFDLSLLEQRDAEGVSMRDALSAAGHDATAIAAIARDPADLLGYVEVHIEQGPVLLERDHPLGIVTAIAGSSRYLLKLGGLASHAGTTPMGMRRDAASAAAEIILLVEQRCSQGEALVGTVGQLHVPNGSVNVIAGACQLSLDIRAASDSVRQAAVDDILDGVAAICARRQIDVDIELLLSASAAPCAPWLMAQLGEAVESVGLEPYRLLSGAGHDAMAMASITDVAMLFTRCGNGGISHNPLETMTADDADIAAHALLAFLRQFQPKAT